MSAHQTRSAQVGSVAVLTVGRLAPVGIAVYQGIASVVATATVVLPAFLFVVVTTIAVRQEKLVVALSAARQGREKLCEWKLSTDLSIRTDELWRNLREYKQRPQQLWELWQCLSVRYNLLLGSLREHEHRLQQLWEMWHCLSG